MRFLALSRALLILTAIIGVCFCSSQLSAEISSEASRLVKSSRHLEVCALTNDRVSAGERGFLFFDLLDSVLSKDNVLAWSFASKQQLLSGSGSIASPQPVYWGPTVGQTQPALAQDPLYRHSKIMFRADAAKVIGKHSFRHKGSGAATIQMSGEQEFLELPQVEPVAGDPSKGFEVRWLPVVRAVGYKVCVLEGRPNSTWLSSRQNWLALGSTEALRTGVLLNTTHCSVPAGIFQGRVSVTVMAVSKETYATGSLPIVGWAESQSCVEFGHN